MLESSNSRVRSRRKTMGQMLPCLMMSYMYVILKRGDASGNSYRIHTRKLCHQVQPL